MFSADFRGDFYKTFILSALGAGSQDEESNQGYLKYTCCRREFLRRDVSNLWKNSAKGHLPKFHPIDPKPYKSNSQSSLPFSPARGTQTEEVWATRISRILSIEVRSSEEFRTKVHCVQQTITWARGKPNISSIGDKATSKNSGQKSIVSSRLLPEPEENLTYKCWYRSLHTPTAYNSAWK